MMNVSEFHVISVDYYLVENNADVLRGRPKNPRRNVGAVLSKELSSIKC